MGAIISGKAIALWIKQYWPMDTPATALAMIMTGVAIMIWILRRDPIFYASFKERCTIAAKAFLSGLVSTILFPWLVVKGLFFSPSAVDGVSRFDSFKTMFVLASFVVILRLGAGGATIEDLRIGPDVKNRGDAIGALVTTTTATSTVKVRISSGGAKAKEKGSRRKGARAKKGKAKKDRYRPFAYIKKLASEPLTFYEVLVLLVFAMLYYFRKDFSEGDNNNLFDRLTDAFGFGLARRYGTPVEPEAPKPDPMFADTGAPSPAVEAAPLVVVDPAASPVGGRRKKPSLDKDPFM